MTYFGSFGNNNIYLQGNTNTGVTPNNDFGLYGAKYRACSCLCNFCNSNYSLRSAIDLICFPKYDVPVPGLPQTLNLGAPRNEDRSFGANLRSSTGISGANYTSPFTSTSQATSYMYFNTGLSNEQNYIGVTATVSSGYAWASWRANSSSGTSVADAQSTNFYYNSTYGGISFLNIKELWATATVSSSPPTVTTGTVSYSSTDGYISMAGSVTSAGSATVTGRGFVGGTSTNPTTSSNIFQVTAGSGTGIFSGTQSDDNLLVGPNGTFYYVRAYAINSVGTSYGTNKSVLVTSSGTGWSDRRLKTNINYKRTSPSGLKVYHFNYIEPELYGEGVFEGVMADEIPQEYVITAANGYKKVLYSGIDVDFKKVEDIKK